MEYWQSVAFLDVGHLSDIARAAEDHALSGVAFGDHLVTPQTVTSRYPHREDGRVTWDPSAPLPDPWVSIGALSAITQQLRFMTHVYVLPLRDPFTAAKAISTALCFAPGRIVLGVGAGWMKEEFLLTGQDYGTRGRRLDESLELLSRLLTGGMVDYRGDLIDAPPVQLSPVPPSSPPILVGGYSRRALRRAVDRGGWIGSAVNRLEDLGEVIKQLHELRRQTGQEDAEFEIAVTTKQPPDVEFYRRLAQLGVTKIINGPHPSAPSREASLRDWITMVERFSAAAQQVEH